ncbi:hepatocyte growth factor receptor-like isoform X2 [Oscarella lobularis]|uniref:hepatocyte growth factor receptor-like isoform X2 n=1 Tax=Oscarella lobularis TaxID=121494 RepID=UPI003313B8A8
MQRKASDSGSPVDSIEPHQLFDRRDFSYDEENDFIGGGGFAEVFRALLVETGQQVAAKVLFRMEHKKLRGRLEKKEISSLRREAVILLQAQENPYIIHFIGICEAPSHYTLLLEYVDGEDLEKLICAEKENEKFEKWETRVDLACQVADGMTYLHTHQPRIVHLDLKPSNVLTKETSDGYHCKITDFGLSKMKGLTSASKTSTSKEIIHPAGTVIFIAPERYFGNCPYGDSEGLAKCDVYSFGIILWELKERRQPFEGEIPNVLHEIVKSGKAVSPSKNPSPYGFADLEKECYSFYPEERPLFAEVLARLQSIQAIVKRQGGDLLLWTMSPFPDSNVEPEIGYHSENVLPVLLSRDQIIIEAKIGNGAFGEVYKGILQNARPHDKIEIAVKAIKELSSRREDELFKREFSVMVSLKHPNVLPLIGVCFEKSGGSSTDLGPLIVMPFMKNGDVQSYLRNLREKADMISASENPDSNYPIKVELLLQFSLQIASGMTYLREKRIIHRDLAARNCMLSENMIVKIADFGLAHQLDDDYYQVNTVTTLPIKWLAPECIADKKFTFQADVWSFGITLWELFSLGMDPYTGMQNREVFDFLVQGRRLQKPSLCPTVIPISEDL